jgi:hypothetical protein
MDGNLAAAIARIAESNPALREVGGPYEGGRARVGLPAERVVLAGGQLIQLFAPESFTPLQILWRRLAPDGLGAISASTTRTVEIGSFTVPENMALLLVEQQFTSYRFTGAAAGDVVAVEEDRLAYQIAFDSNVGQQRMEQVAYQIFPSVDSQNRTAYNRNEPVGAPVATGLGSADRAASGLTVLPAPTVSPLGYTSPQAVAPAQPQTFLDAASSPSNQAAGNALQPSSRRVVQGSQRMPWTRVVPSSRTVQWKAVAVASVPIPLAFFEVVASGYLFPLGALEEILATTRPPSR